MLPREGDTHLPGAALGAEDGDVPAPMPYLSVDVSGLGSTTSNAAGLWSIAGSGLPLEVVVDTEAWVKVRDHSGRLAWIEKSALGGAKSVMIKAETSVIRQQPRADADAVFHAARGVLLNVTGDVDAYGWLPVKNAGGLAGWLPAHEAWGR